MKKDSRKPTIRHHSTHEYPRQWFSKFPDLQSKYDQDVTNAFTASSTQGGGLQAAQTLEENFFAICESLKIIATLYGIAGPGHNNTSKFSQMIDLVNKMNMNLKMVRTNLGKDELGKYYAEMLSIQSNLSDSKNQVGKLVDYLNKSYKAVTDMIDLYRQSQGPTS